MIKNNHNKNNKNFELDELILKQAIAFFENGKSIRQILNLLPDHQKALKEIFEIIKMLKRGREKIIPSKEVLTSILEQIPSKAKAAVTNLGLDRLSNRGVLKGRHSMLQGLEKLVKEAKLMFGGWRMLVPVSAVAAIIIFLTLVQLTDLKSLTIVQKISPVNTVSTVTELENLLNIVDEAESSVEKAFSDFDNISESEDNNFLDL